MERLLTGMKKLLYPPVPLRVCLIVLGFGSLIPAFYSPLSETPVVYGAYVWSAYALAMAAAWAVRIGRTLRKARKRFIENHGLAARYVSDRYFRVSISLGCSLVINLAYAALKAVAAVLISSAWTGFIAAYYLVLSFVRLYLMTRFSKDKEHDPAKEIRTYRWTAMFLLFINLALTALIYKIVQEGESYTYPGTIIFAYAAYTFYSFGSSICHMVRYRRFHSPLLSAVKTVGFTTALVSVLSLQTAMLTQFGTEQDVSHRIANAMTGTAVCLAILLISVLMFVQAGKMTKNSQSDLSKIKEATDDTYISSRR